MRKVAIIGTNGLPAKYGGFETLANFLVENLNKEHNELIVYCSKTSKEERLLTYNGAKLIYFPFKANGWQSMIYDFVTIVHAFFTASDLIILGFSGAFAFPLNKIFKKNIIFNIGGIEWQKVRGSKLTSKIEVLIKKYMEKICVKNSNAIIIDNEHFKNYIKTTYNKEPILAEYGGDHAENIMINDSLLKKYSFLKSNYALSVSRAQDDMNIHIIIEAYKKNKNQKIVIVSNWNISDYGKELYKDNHNKYDNIILLGAIYDHLEINAIRSNCNLYIHSHSLCGTAPSLVEAMSLNLAVICFDVPTNRFTTENKSLYFNNSDSLAELIEGIDDKKQNIIKNKMFEIANNRYKWSRISKIYEEHLT